MHRKLLKTVILPDNVLSLTHPESGRVYWYSACAMVTTASLPPENTHTRQTKSSFEMALNNVKYNDFKVMIVF